MRGGIEVNGGLEGSEGAQDEASQHSLHKCFSFGAKVHNQDNAPKC